MSYVSHVQFANHNNSSFHHPSQHLDHLLKRILFCKDSTSITRHIVKTCPVCLLSAPRMVRKIIGEQRTHLSAPGETLVCDSAIVPKSSSGNSKLLIIVDGTTGKIAAYPSKNLTAQVAAKHIFTHICATSRPASVACDHGSEFKSGLQDQLATYNIALEATSPYIKSSTSTAECSIRLLKRALKRICLPANKLLFPLRTEGLNRLRHSVIEQMYILH